LSKDNINTIKKNTEALLLVDASQEVGSYVNTEKWKCILSLGRNENGIHNSNKANESFEKVSING
jgi:hypothetical protein